MVNASKELDFLDSFVDGVHRSILGQCYREASLSPDTSTQIGAVIVDTAGRVCHNTLSYNGFCYGWEPTQEDYERPRKYSVTEHAERRAIYRAAKYGIKLDGATLYSTWAACTDCARAIVESGIYKLVRHFPPHDETVDRWLESVSLGDELMRAGNVQIIDVHGSIPESFPILRGGERFDPALIME